MIADSQKASLPVSTEAWVVRAHPQSDMQLLGPGQDIGSHTGPQISGPGNFRLLTLLRVGWDRQFLVPPPGRAMFVWGVQTTSILHPFWSARLCPQAPLSFAGWAGTPGFLWPPEKGRLGRISQSLLEQRLPPASSGWAGRRAEAGGGRAGGGEEEGKSWQADSRALSASIAERRLVWCGAGQEQGEAFLPLCSPHPAL